MPDSTAKPKVTDAPGLVMRKSASGWTATWQCRTDIAKRGYPIKSQRLFECGETLTAMDRAQIAERCTALQNEMLAWSRGGMPPNGGGGGKSPNGGGGGKFNGTLGSLIRCYTTDPDSPFHQLRASSKVQYRHCLDRLHDGHGATPIADIRLHTVTAWRTKWIAEMRTNARRDSTTGVTVGNMLVTMLRVVLGYGIDAFQHDGCTLARASLSRSKFEKPKRPKQTLTREQVIAFRAKAHALGHPSMALAAALQFELGFRQKDIIGEWLLLADPVSPPSDVVFERHKWVWGIRWNQLRQLKSGALNLDYITSKRGKEWSGDISKLPMVMEELATLPQPLPKSGPVVVDEVSGRPFQQMTFRRRWRKIADAVGIPADVCSCHSRSGRITELLGMGVPINAVKHYVGHSDIRTTEGYDRGAEAAIDAALTRTSAAVISFPKRGAKEA